MPIEGSRNLSTFSNMTAKFKGSNQTEYEIRDFKKEDNNAMNQFIINESF